MPASRSVHGSSSWIAAISARVLQRSMPAITLATSSRGGVPENPIFHVRVGAGGGGTGVGAGLLQPSAPAIVVAAPRDAADSSRRREARIFSATDRHGFHGLRRLLPVLRRAFALVTPRETCETLACLLRPRPPPLA